MTPTQTMIARLDESTGQMGHALTKLVARYGDDDEFVLMASAALHRRFKLLSYLRERDETR